MQHMAISLFQLAVRPRLRKPLGGGKAAPRRGALCWPLGASGEVVLDLGSGAGIDCFIAAKQVGADGHVVGVDMPGAPVASRHGAARGRRRCCRRRAATPRRSRWPTCRAPHSGQLAEGFLAAGLEEYTAT